MLVDFALVAMIVAMIGWEVGRWGWFALVHMDPLWSGGKKRDKGNRGIRPMMHKQFVEAFWPVLTNPFEQSNAEDRSLLDGYFFICLTGGGVWTVF